MSQTKLIYLTDAYTKEVEATVVEVLNKGTQTAVILDQTIMYPTGGGQLCDRGQIVGANGSLEVKDVSYNGGNPLHLGLLSDTITAGEKVTVTLDWNRRYQHMQEHTAGHILDEAVRASIPGIKGVDGMHGISDKYYVEFDQPIADTKLPKLQEAVNSLINNNESITTRMVTKEDIDKEGIVLPFKLPENKPLRLIQFGNRAATPDGGTQLKSTGESWPITLTKLESKDTHTIIHYHVAKPETPPEAPPNKSTPKQTVAASGSVSLETFTKQVQELVKSAQSATKTEAERIEYLGKKGKLNQVAGLMRELGSADKAEAGKALNAIKKQLEEYFQVSSVNQPSDWLDVTEPGIMPSIGHIHPVSQAIEEITRIFESIGFTRVRYPEVDWDTYAFANLNMPTNHPARDEWETFFIDTPTDHKMGQMVLTPHTSNGQTREMERVGKPPIRMLNIGKCYRRQQDVTHTAMFHQFEGLVVDKGINIQHLKGTLDYFAQKFYGPSAKSRIRPFMFKFTEPSFEVDFSCIHCNGKGCRFCKSGWHEVGGAGMVHPNVLRAGGINPDEYTGFAFGWGVERVYTLKPGLSLDDIRPLYGNNLDFLGQF